MSKLTSKQSKPSLKAASTKTPAPSATPQAELTGSKAGERAEKGKNGRGPKSSGGQAASKRNMTRKKVCSLIFILKTGTGGSNTVPPIFTLLLSFHYVTAC